MHQLAAVRLHPVLHVLHLADCQARADRVRHRGLDLAAAPTSSAPTSGPRRPTSSRGTCRTPRSRPSPCATCLAATLAASYGIYGPGFELGDNRPAGNGKEEFLDSEKYEVRALGPDAGRRCAARSPGVNRDPHRAAGAAHDPYAAASTASPTTSCSCTRRPPTTAPSPTPTTPRATPSLCVANLDPPVGPGGDVLDLDLVALGVDPARPFQVHDLLTDRTSPGTGHHPYVELHPAEQPGHLLRVEPAPGRPR